MPVWISCVSVCVCAMVLWPYSPCKAAAIAVREMVAMAQPQQAMRLPPAVVTKVNEIMDSQKPINTQVDQILDVFLGHGFARKQTIKPC